MHPLLVVIYVVAALVTAAYVFFLRSQGQFTGNAGSRESSPSKGTPGGEIVLTGFFAPLGQLVGSVSPFTNKVETYLRFTGLPFRTQNGGFADAPKGRVGACLAPGPSTPHRKALHCRAASTQGLILPRGKHLHHKPAQVTTTSTSASVS